MFKKLLIGLFCVALGSRAWAQLESPQYVSDAQGIVFDELARAALARNPDLAVARESLRQAEARRMQGQLRPNPAIEVSRTTDILFGNEGDKAFSLTYSQPVELGGKRSKRVRLEEIAMDAAKADIADAERRLIGQLRSLYVQAIGAASRMDLFDRLDRLNDQMTSVMEVRLRAGDASRLDSRLLAAQTNQVRAQRLIAENQLAGIMLQIRTLAGFLPPEPLLLKRPRPLPEISDTEAAVVQQALQKRPDLQAARLREALADAGVILAKAQAVPDATAFVRYGRESVPIVSPGGQLVAFDRDNVMEFGVSIPLPLFNREQGSIAESASRRAQATSQRQALETAIRQEVLLAYRRYTTAQRTLQILQTGVVQPNQESLQIVQLAYNLGEMRLLDIVNQQRAVVDAGTSLVDAQTEFDSAFADLQLAMGTGGPF
jgi:cobalt-zinc-cadmium efflux system outer membrane protein